MVAIYSLHHSLSLSTRPSLVTHRSPSCLSQPLVLCFRNKSGIYNPYSLTLAAGCCAAKQNGDDKSKEQPQRRRPILKRAYFFNLITRGKQEVDTEFSILEGALAVDSPASGIDQFKSLLEGRRYDPEDLQKAAWKLEMSGKEEKAVQMLEKKLSEIERDNQKFGIEAFHLRLLLSELWIYQGKYEQAKEQCKSLIGKGPSLKLPLYLAVIYELMGDTKNSKDIWEDVQKGSSSTMESSNSSLLSDATELIMIELGINNISFTDFQKHVEKLRQEIKRE